ncbi:MAG: AAA family ATPase [Planctomycetota bacterium]
MMIHSLKFNNFCSFHGEAEISFTVGVQAPDREFFADSQAEDIRINKVMAIIGPNGSGKTNLLKPLAFLKYFTLDSFRTLTAEEKIPVDSFAFTTSNELGSNFVIVFEVNGSIYRYELLVNHKQVIHEALFQKRRNKYSYLFKLDRSSKEDHLSQLKYFDIKAVKSILRPNASILSVLRQIDHDKSKPILRFFESIATNVIRFGRAVHKPDEHIGLVLDTADFFEKSPELKNKAEQILKNMDLGLSGVRTRKEKIQKNNEEGTTEVVLPYGLHLFNNKEHELSLFNESNGTQNLYVLLKDILPILETGGIAVIDEFEVDLHAHMIPPLLELFFNPSTNPKNAQLIFTCHSVSVLNVLDKTQILLVEKNDNCVSEVWRLDSMRGIRRDDNLYAKYMSGAYGAVPEV